MDRYDYESRRVTRVNLRCCGEVLISLVSEDAIGDNCFWVVTDGPGLSVNFAQARALSRTFLTAVISLSHHHNDNQN